MNPETPTYASRAGQKLHTALETFDLDVSGLICADLGCSTGGFVDCLLQHGAKHVYAVDTAYGELAWKLRQDPRVTVLERSNALHLEPVAVCDLVTVDLGWTPQHLAIPAASRWLAPGTVDSQRTGGTGAAAKSGGGRIISLIKPHYEDTRKAFAGKKKGTLDDDQAGVITERVIQDLEKQGFKTLKTVQSPIRGGKGGNLEVLALLQPLQPDPVD